MGDLHAVDGDNDPQDTQSWDDFWADVRPADRTEIICGVEVLVPSDCTLDFTRRLGELEQSDSEDDLRELIAMLFGDGVLDEWTDAGMTARQLQTALLWGIAHANGNPMSFARAYELAQGAAEGKAPAAPNRAQRRAAARPRSAASGGRSKPTSSASTASRRTTSRG